ANVAGRIPTSIAPSSVTEADYYDGPDLLVSYDYATQRLSMKLDPAGAGYVKTTTLSLASDLGNILNIPTTKTILNSKGELTDYNLIPNGDPFRDVEDQRYGMKVVYDSVNSIFRFQSGTTGDTSSLAVSLTQVDGEDDPNMVALFGLHSDSGTVNQSDVALRGIVSQPAVAFGDVASVFSTNSFEVNETNNKFLVTVDGIKGTVVLPENNNCTLDIFLENLQKGINSLTANNTDNLNTTDYTADIPGSTPATVNGVQVTYDPIRGRLTFTTGTTGTESYIKITGDAYWGLENVEAGRGSVSTWINPTQHRDLVGGNLQSKYIDSAGNETTSPDGFGLPLPPWSPVFLQKGQLTFDTGGKLVSPLSGTQLETVYLAGGKGALTININYSGSTQYQSSFAVLSQSQDGAPEGDLVGVTIGNDGLVSASFSNGTQKSLAKILLTNFSSPSGLRQIGDSSFLASAASGRPQLGNAGSAGFGTLRAGATERSNVDLTNELVDLITSQRNFQANAKAIETSSTMTSAIINIRS
ncbi:MAG: flagellar hook-basal body complex protein, partial [Hylemonella sp.]